MYEGKSRELWSQTSMVAVLLANANRDPKKQPSAYELCDFNPWEMGRSEKTNKSITPKNITALKGFL